MKGNTHVNILFDVVVPQKFRLSDHELINLINKELKTKCEEYTKVEVNFVLNVDKEYV